MTKQNCITKEKYQELYKSNEESEKRMDLSVVEDLETFIQYIKAGLINDYRLPNGDRSRTFLLCLLDEDQRKKLEQKDYDFMETFFLNYKGEADVLEAEWKASESNMKFTKSDCLRETYFINAEITNPTNI